MTPLQYQSSADVITGGCALGVREIRAPTYVSNAIAAPPLMRPTILIASMHSVMRPLYVSWRCHPHGEPGGGALGGRFVIAIFLSGVSLPLLRLRRPRRLSADHEAGSALDHLAVRVGSQPLEQRVHPLARGLGARWRRLIALRRAARRGWGRFLRVRHGVVLDAQDVRRERLLTRCLHNSRAVEAYF